MGMKILTTRERVLNAVLLAERIVGKKEALPVLSCVLLEAGRSDGAGHVVVRATNLEAGIGISVPCDVEDTGVIAVPAAALSQTLRSVSSEKISFKTEEGNLVIESRGTKTLIKAIPHQEFPALGGREEKKGITI